MIISLWLIMQKSCRVIISTPVLLLGGTEMQMLMLVEALLSSDYDVIINCYYEYDKRIISLFESKGAHVFCHDLKRSDGLLKLLSALAKYYRKRRPDIVHVQYLAPGLVPIVAARLAGIRTVFATVHIAGSVAYGRKAKFLLRLAAKFCTAFFCVSKGVEEFWFGDSELFDPANVNKGRKHFTVYNAIDTFTIANTVNAVDRHKMKETLGIAGCPAIGIVGRLAHQKGHIILIDAMVEVIREFPDVVLMIIGEGPDRQRLEKKAIALYINNNILWMGAQPQNKVFEFYGIMDIFVMPSLYEGFGLTAAEAMAASVPVVGTNVEGLSEVIEDGVSGYLIPAGNSQALGDAVIKLLKDPQKAKVFGQNGCKRAERLFPLARFNASMIGIYDNF